LAFGASTLVININPMNKLPNDEEYQPHREEGHSNEK